MPSSCEPSALIPSGNPPEIRAGNPPVACLVVRPIRTWICAFARLNLAACPPRKNSSANPVRW
jgi:hypothetical protein